MSETSGVPEINFTLNASNVIQQPTDATLTAQGMPADARAVGERFTEVNETITDLAADMSGVSDKVDTAVLVTSQTLEAEEQEQARENIGLGTAATKGVANDLTTQTAGTDVLDAYQGKLLKDAIDGLGGAASKGVANDLTTQTAGTDVLDAYQGKLLKDAIDETKGNLGNAILKTEQSLTAAEQSQARENIGAADDSLVLKKEAQTISAETQVTVRQNIGALGATDAVLTTAQTLSAETQAQVRTNIGAAADAEAVKVTAQTLTTAQQAQARTNIGLGSMFLLADYSTDFSIEASDYIHVTKTDLGITDIEGYTILGIRRAWTSKIAVYVSRFSATGTTVSSYTDIILSLRNASSSTTTGSVGVTLVWVKSDLVSLVQ